MGTSKSKKRVKIVESIASAISSNKIFDVIDYRNRNEDYIKQYMHQPLISELEALYEDLELSKSTDKDLIRQKAKDCLLWEGDVNTTVNNFTFFGTQHRPDFVVKIDKLKVAVEVKKGESGSSLREGIGQSLVYASEFDFVVYLYVDISKDKKIRDSMGGSQEQELINDLWDSHNVLFQVV
tara:strand:+ start:13642 stop:14184 length:543 start_codon:yes stop_codon:yes gene_type:complete